MDFSKLFNTFAKGVMGSASKAASNAITGALTGNLIKFKSYLSARCELDSSVWETAAGDADAIGDNYASHSATFSFSELGELWDVVPDDWANTFVQAITSFGVDCESGKALMVTNSQGRNFSLAAVTDDVRTIVLNSIRSVTADQDITDVLLVARTLNGPVPVIYRKNDQLRLNPIVPGALCAVRNSTSLADTTVLGMLGYASDVLNAPTVDTSIRGYIRSLLSKYNLSDQGDLLSNLQAINNECGASVGVTILSNARNLYQYAQDVDENTKSINCFTTFWDLVKDQCDSLGINRALMELIDMARSIKKDLSSFLMTVNTKAAAIRQVVQGAVNAWNTGGYSGLSSYILSFWHTAATIVSEDGSLQFTDNNAFIPKQYIAGTIASVVQILGTVAGVIATAVGYTVGPVLAIAAQGVAGIIKSIQYDASKTRCGVQTSEDAFSQICPWALQQRTKQYIYRGVVTNKFVSQLTEISETGAVLLEVPGGFLLVGKAPQSESDVSRQAASVRFEFHPSTADTYDGFVSNFMPLYVQSSWQFDTGGGYQGKCTTIAHVGRELRNGLEYYWSHFEGGKPFINSGNSDVLSVDEDKRLKNAVCCNIAIFLLWLCSVYYDNTDGIDIAFETSTDFTTIIISPDTQLATGAGFNDVKSIAAWLALCCPESGFINKSYYPGSHNSLLVELNSWSPLATACANWKDNSYLSNSLDAVEKRGWCGSALPLTGQLDWGIVPALYDGSTFYSWILVSAFLTIAIAAITVVTVLKVRKWRTNKALENKAKVEHAYDNYKANPTAENLKAYNSARIKNNMMSTITGGSKVAKGDYWGSTDSSSGGGSSDDGSTVKDLVSQITGSPESTAFRDGASVTDVKCVEDVIRIITG